MPSRACLHPCHEDLRYLHDFPQACPPKRPTNPRPTTATGSGSKRTITEHAGALTGTWSGLGVFAVLAFGTAVTAGVTVAASRQEQRTEATGVDQQAQRARWAVSSEADRYVAAAAQVAAAVGAGDGVSAAQFARLVAPLHQRRLAGAAGVVLVVPAADLEHDILESYEEHHVADVLCTELAGLKPDAERFDAKTTVLIETVTHHIEEEKQDWFPKVRAALSRTQLQEIGAGLLELKTSAPRRPSQPSALKKTIDAVIS
jgi:hypothetical protein